MKAKKTIDNDKRASSKPLDNKSSYGDNSRPASCWYYLKRPKK